MRNPLLEEAGQIYVRRREFLSLHLVYVIGTAVFAILLWPSQGIMYFFRTETIPASFQATVITQAIVLTALSLYIGLDRVAEAYLIRYSEWIERTAIPIRVLFTGKVVVAFVHTLFLVSVGLPFAVVAAGPAGIPLRAVAASETIVLLAAMTGRFVGMLVSHLGETRYVIRIVGSWIFLAFLFVATVQLLPELNPIIAVVRQHSESSVFMQLDGGVPGDENPLLASGLPLLALLAATAALFWFTLYRHRVVAVREGRRAA